MGEAVRHEEVIDMVEYLEGTIAGMDAAVSEWLAKRNGLAIRLAAMKAATDPEVLAAAEDYEARVRENRPYEDAEDAEALIAEAHRHFAP